MNRSRLTAALAAISVLCGATQTMAQTCKPALAIKETRFSEVRDQQRIWTGVMAVDASRCTTTSGPFEIRFIRLMENGPDLPFTERFTWRPGRNEVSLDFWWNESVQDFWIANVAPCGCAD